LNWKKLIVIFFFKFFSPTLFASVGLVNENVGFFRKKRHLVMPEILEKYWEVLTIRSRRTRRLENIFYNKFQKFFLHFEKKISVKD